MQEPHGPERPPALEPWWHQDEEPEFLVLPESGSEGQGSHAPPIVARLAALERRGLSTASQIEALRDEVSKLHGVIRAAAAQVGEALRGTGALVQSSVEDASRAMGEEHAATMDRYANGFAEAVRPLADGVERVERLRTLVEAMAKRRGFRELVRSEQVLREEQASLARLLVESGADAAARVATMDSRIAQLEERLEDATREAASLRDVPAATTERLSAAIERLRGELTGDLEERFATQVESSVRRLRAELEAGLPVKEALGRLGDVAGTQDDLTRVQRDLDAVAASLKTEARSLHDRIQSWGPPRTAPRLAREVHHLSERLNDLEDEIRDGFAERVAASVEARVTAAISDRRGRRRLRRRTTS